MLRHQARRWPNVGLLLDHRLRRWPHIKPTLTAIYSQFHTIISVNNCCRNFLFKVKTNEQIL